MAKIKVRKSAVVAQKGAAQPEQKSAPKKPSRQQFRDARVVVRPTTIPYRFWKEWSRALGRNDFLLLHDLTAEGSPIRESFGDRDGFMDRIRRQRGSVPGMRGLDLLRIRLEGPDVVHVLQVDLSPDRAERTFTAERWFLIRGEFGFRVHHIDRVEVPREREPSTVGFEDFPEIPEALSALAPRERSWREVLAEREKERDADAAAEAVLAAEDAAEEAEEGNGGEPLA